MASPEHALSTPGADATAYRTAERDLWGSLGVSTVERRLPLRRVGSTVRVQEIGSGPPILFVHGGSTCGTSWADLAAALPRRFAASLPRASLVVLPGIGHAPWMDATQLVAALVSERLEGSEVP